MAAQKIHFFSIDALPWSMLQQFLDRGELPNFQKLEKQGASAQGMVPPGPDATTPAAHAALLCGCGALEHGIFSYEEPAIENGIIYPWKKRIGFDAMRFKAEPLWVNFLKAGRKVALIHFPLSTPIEALTTSQKFGANFSEHLFAMESFSQRLTPEIVRKDVNSDDDFNLRLSDGTKVPLPKRAPKVMEPAIFKEKKGGLWRIRFEAERAGEPDLHFLTPFSGISSNRDDLINACLDQVGPFAASATTYSYGTDKLGNRIYKGGNGVAEKRMAQGMELLGQQFYKTMEFALEKISPEAGFYYFNGIDLCLHLWMAYLDPASPAYSKKVYDALFPMVRSMFQWADKMVGLLLDSLAPEDLLVVVSDHGMAPLEARFFPNQVLANAGYAVWDAKEQEPVLSQSRAIYNESNSGYIVLNLKSRGGIVEDEEAPELTQKIASLFEPYLANILDKIELTSRTPQIQNLGELYLVPKFKITLQEEVEGKVFEEFFGGQHHYWGDSEPMQAVLYFKGAGVPAGMKLGRRSHLEVAATVAALAGINPPNKARMGPIKF